MQITVCDIIALTIGAIEIIYMNYRKWILPFELCPIYLGMESFCSTATIYLIIALNLHAISTYNLAVKTIQREEKLQKDQQPEDDAYEVAINVQEQRTITIDYSKRKNSISVILPVLFIWFLAASVSIPLFVFGSVLPSEENPKICGILNFDQNNNLLMQLLVFIVRIGIPTVCLLSTSICVIVKLFLKSSKIRPCGLEENVSSILWTAIIISITFIVFSMQHIYGSLLFEVISKPFMHYKYPEFNKMILIIFCMVHYALSAIRPIFYCLLEKNLLNHILFGCFKKKKHIKIVNK